MLDNLAAAVAARAVRILLACTLSLTSAAACAGASLFVDDAAVTSAGRCQAENWLRAYSPGQEFTSVPACNVGGTEFGLGISQFARPSTGPILNLGAKRLLRDIDGGRWGAALSIGATWNGDRDRLDGVNVNLPVSIALDAQANTLLHVNLGASRLRHTRTALTGGVGLEHTLDARWTLLAEAYGDDLGVVVSQLGVRRTINDAVTLDLIAGTQDGLPSSPWLTIGLNVLLPQ